MPEFSWVEPGYFDGVINNKHVFQATDQHPDHDVSAGDDLIRQIYNAVRSSPLWEKTALVITYDEVRSCEERSDEIQHGIFSE